MNITPKVEQLMRSEYAPEINRMLDAGDSPRSVHKYLESVGFKISAPTVYKYSNMRSAGLLEKEKPNVPDTVTGTPDEPPKELEVTSAPRLRSELELLDRIIEKGFEAVKEIEPEEITPKIAMDAIRLKNELTGGNHACLTEYGYYQLKALHEREWEMVIRYLMTLIPEELHDEVRRHVEEIEESVYMGTPWQDEYLRSKGKAAV